MTGSRSKRFSWIRLGPLSRTTGGFPWPVVLLWGVSLVLLGVVIVLESQLVVLAFVSALIATGIILVAMALAAAWRSWRGRPRRVRSLER